MTLDEAAIKVRDGRVFDSGLMNAIAASKEIQGFFFAALEKNPHEQPDLLERISYTCIRIGQEMERRRNDESLLLLLQAAAHALRSYQYGNASPDLAEEVAEHIEALLAKREREQ